MADTDVVIIGAGLTGLSAAYHLEINGFHNYILLEKENSLGGLCRSIQQDGFTFDYTGHLLHINDPYFRQLIDTVVGLEQFNNIERRSYIYSQGCFTQYPYQINMHGLPVSTITECIKGYLERPRKKNCSSFKNWVLTHFGAGFAKYFFFPYQEKIFDIPIEKLSASWTGRFVPQTSLDQIIGGALSPQAIPIGYNAQFFYPKRQGIFFWVNKLAQKLQTQPQTQSTVTNIDLAKRIITLANKNSIKYKQLITTIPLDELLGIITEPSSSSLKKARSKLQCTSVININLGLNRADLSDKHWIYYPEKQFPFYRIGFPHNFSEHMAPLGCSSLYAEYGALNKTGEHIKESLIQSKQALKTLWNIAEHEILTEKNLFIKHGYVIFDRWRDNNLQPLLKELAFYNVHSVGRYGAWKYASMQEGILDGKEVAQEILKQQPLHHPSTLNLFTQANI